MKQLIIIPLNWRADMTPANPEIHAAASAFSEEQFGAKLEAASYYKMWLAAECEGATLVRAWGLVALANAIDVPLFHVRTPAAQPEEVRSFDRANWLLVERMKTFLQDNGAAGRGVFVHISPESRKATMLKHLLRRLGAKESNRVLVEV